MQKFNAWLSALRLRTLPLALSCIVLSGSVAYAYKTLNYKALILAVLTTILLQILSNLANDLGDTLNGADSSERVGPQRAVQSGEISVREMKNAVIVFALLSFISGIALVFEGTRGISTFVVLFYIFLGIGSIYAAIRYTLGKNPYGYKGFGDISVFLFFGVVGVLGSFYLFTQTIMFSLILPACSLGLFSAAVLNVNNMRDFNSDKKAGKNTMVVYMGLDKAKVYHTALIAAAVSLSVLFMLLNLNNLYQFVYLIAVLPLLALHLKTVYSTNEPALLDPELKKLALTTLLFAILFGVCYINFA
ncbi:MAG: 1,4-dihydroxy-2-naphthoate polyprenyltransferase [Luteibaculaceae bacterium]